MTATVETVRQRLRTLGDDMELGGVRLSEHLSPGKLLRGRLVLAAAALGDPPDLQQALRYAVLVELLHAGALLHDDITDRSTLRRGQPTLWSRVGDRSAVLAGAALIVLAGDALADAPAWLRRQAGETLRDIAGGQTDELMELFSTRVSPQAYIRRARAKTGAFYELSARLGAAAGGLDARTTEVLRCFASTVGLAFQLADDVRDLVGDAALGRPPGTDLQAGVYTLPILLTTSGAFSGGERLGTLLRGTNRRDAGVRLLTENGAIAATVQEARRLQDVALGSLAALPASPARAELERYAADLLGTLPDHVTVPSPSRPNEPPGEDQPTAPHFVLPGLAALLHPTLTLRLAAIPYRATGLTALAQFAAAGMAVAALADELGSVGRADAAGIVGTIDLLLAQLFNLLPAFPAPVVCRACDTLADMLIEAAQRTGTAPAPSVCVDGETLQTFFDTITHLTAPSAEAAAVTC